VLLLFTGGKTNKEIAQTLFLGEGTVRNYASSIFLKLASVTAQKLRRMPSNMI